MSFSTSSSESSVACAICLMESPILEKRETALRLSKMGLSIKQIAQATELSEDDVLKLIQK